MFSRPAILTAACIALVAVPAGTGAQGPAPIQQTRHWDGQGVAPVYEGFGINPDGTFNMWFGYMNRNYEEEQLDIPVGADNRFEPGTSGPRAADTFRTRAVARTSSASSSRKTSASQPSSCGP